MPEHCLSELSRRFPQSALGRFGKGGHVMNISLAISKLHRSWRSVSLKFTQLVRYILSPLLIQTELMKLVIDPPIKRFAQRHTYLGTDAIAARDLGFAMAGRQPAGASYSISSLEKRTDSLLSITSAAHMPPTQPLKRQPSPELKRREESVKPEFAPPAKRARPMSPPRDRDRDRFSDGPRRRLGSPAAWEKDRDREPHPMKRERETDYKSTTLPAVLTWFVGQLPNPGSFDGQFSPLARRSAIARGNLTYAGCFGRFVSQAPYSGRTIS